MFTVYSLSTRTKYSDKKGKFKQKKFLISLFLEELWSGLFVSFLSQIGTIGKFQFRKNSHFFTKVLLYP